MNAPRRIDLHCHSEASNKTLEAALNAINCPECYSTANEVYAQAKRRGMDFVTITDHDSILGALSIADRKDVLVGEELTCWFPEDDCKMHVLVFGLTPQQHDALQALADNIYDVAEYIHTHRIAHAVAHPIYRQNDKLERWHLERLILLFKGFECLNGAHSSLHREAFEPMLDRLTEYEIGRLSERHNLAPRWPQPWIKARTAGSDDHGLLNIGRTWTEFPSTVQTVEDLLQCLREGNCRPGGEAGSSAKLAHTFYSVAVRYYTRHILQPVAKPNLPTMLLQTIVGERTAPSKKQLAGMALKHKVKKICGKAVSPLTKLWNRPAPRREVSADPLTSGMDGHIGTGILKNLFISSLRQRIGEHPGLLEVAEKGLPPLGEHEEMFKFISQLNRDVSAGVSDAVFGSVDQASFTGLFDSIAAILAQQFVMSPYYFALFHQNKERQLLREITGQQVERDPSKLKIGLFTDTLDDVNGVARFIRDMAGQAQRTGRTLIVHTSTSSPRYDLPNRRNFQPLVSKPMPLYPQLKLNIPPVLDVLEWADRQQFDAIHISTPGPMGLCGWLVAKMLRAPVLGTYHTDFPAYVHSLTRDHRITNGCTAYMKWLYGQMPAVLSRSKSYLFQLRDLGISDEKLHTLPAAVNTETFCRQQRDVNIWAEHGVKEPLKLLYTGRISVEKNLVLLTEVFKKLCAVRRDTALILAGEGPYQSAMRETLRGLPAYFLEHRNDKQLPALYAGADLFVFPSRTDTLGQAVMEAQACGLPAIVSNEGGPKETVADGQTGVVVAGSDAARWCEIIHDLLNDDLRRQRMAKAAPERVARHSLSNTFETFWAAHAAAMSSIKTGLTNEPLAAPVSTGVAV